MSRYKSEQNAYSSLKKKYVPLWRLDTNTMTVTHFNAVMQTEESKTYTTGSRQVELWKQTDSCYQNAVLSCDAEKMLGLENRFVYMAREAVFECMVYI